jgi:hypothetical protein
MAGALGPVGLAITGIIALLAFLELKFKLLSNTIKGIGDLWNNVSSKLNSAGIKASDVLSRARAGGLVMRGGKQAEAQRQGAGTTNTSTRNLQQNVVVNASGGITPQKAKSIGSSLANNARRGLVSAGVY